MKNENRIIVALDVDRLSRAKEIIKSIKYDVIYKVGMEFFYSFGMDGFKELKKIKPEIKFFLDLKLHDIPNTVANSLKPLISKINPYMLTLHITGGNKMLHEAVNVANKIVKKNKTKKPIILGVTLLTSLKKQDLISLGLGKDINKVVIKLASVAKQSGLDGIVCSAKEIKDVRKYFNDLKIITPGIRFKNDNKEDQARVMSPAEAIKAGADYIVMGRPIIKAKDPNKIIRKIINSLKK